MIMVEGEYNKELHTKTADIACFKVLFAGCPHVQKLLHTLLTNFASRRISKPDNVCALLHRRHLSDYCIVICREIVGSSAALVGPPLAIEHSRSPALPCLEQSATARYVCTLTACLPHSTLRLHPHCLSSTAASRLTSLGAVSVTSSTPV